MNRQESLFLPQKQTVNRYFGTCQLHLNIGLQFFQLILRACFQLNKHSRMQQRFFVSAKFWQQFYHIVDIILSLDALVYIVCGGHHMIFPHCLLNDFSLFHTCHKAVVNSESYPVSVGKVSKDSRFFRWSRIFRNRPAGLVEVSADIVVGVKLDYSRNSSVKKVLCADNFKLFVRQIFLFS